MKNKALPFLLPVFVYLLLFANSCWSQSEKRFAIVPSVFSFSKDNNPYNLSQLTKQLLVSKGFEVVLSDEIFSKEIIENKCQVFTADLIRTSTVFLTKLQLQLKNCENRVVFTSVEGISKEKSYATAHIQAFREMAKTIGEITITTTLPTVEKNIVLPETKSSLATSTPNEFEYKDPEKSIHILLKKTSQPHLYLAQSATQQGVVYLKNGVWYFEYYENKTLHTIVLSLHFLGF